jgi:hypothetical protein
VTVAATQERFQLNFSFDPTSWEGTFDRLEVWRSRGVEQGPYEPLHGATFTPARLPRGSGGPPSPAQTGPGAALNGKTLELLIDEVTPLTITFSGSDPITFAQAVTQILAQGENLVTAYVLDGALVVQTVQGGLRAVLRVTGGEAAPILGLATAEPDSLAFGLDARIVLRHGVENYGLVDPNGSADFFYKARFYNSTSNLASQFSPPFHGSPPVGLAPASLCRCYVDLVDQSGMPAANMEVLVHNQFSGSVAEGKFVVAGGSQQLLTDARGHAEIFLVRGAKITVTIGGTALARDVLVPTDPAVQSLNLLVSDNGTDDLFTVQIPDLNYAVRRTM